MTNETLSRGIECSSCRSKLATYTLRDANGKIIGYLCDHCAQVYNENDYVEMMR